MSSLLIMFASMGEENNKITAKRVPKEQIEKNSNLKACAKALLDQNIRLLISAKDDKGAEYYRVAHEALFTHWELAQKTITRHTKDIQLRDQLEKSSKRWKLAKKEDKKSLLLQDGLPLNEAVDLVERRESELDDLLVAFVRASEERVRRSKRLSRLFWGTLISVSVAVSFFMYGLKKEADRVTNKLVTIVGMYSDEGIDRFSKKNHSIKIFEAIIENFDDSENNEIRRIVSMSYYVKGFTYYAKKEYDKAIEAYEKSIKINPKNDEVYNNMAFAYDAKKEYDKVIEINPKDDEAYNNMGIAYRVKKEYEKAIEAYKKAIEINPKNDTAYTNIGITYYNMGNSYRVRKEYEKAIEVYKKAIEINPKRYEAYNNMGIAYSDKKEYGKAIEIYKKAIEQNANNGSFFVSLFELQLITFQKMNTIFEKNYIENFKDKKEEFIEYEMLKIIKDLTQNKKVDLKAWQSKYEGVPLDWGFDELDEWVKTLKDEALKKKINEALEVFKEHG